MEDPIAATVEPVLTDGQSEIEIQNLVIDKDSIDPTLREIYEEIVRPFPTAVGKAISKKEREETGRKDTTLVYGEISFDSFGTLFIIIMIYFK